MLGKMGILAPSKILLLAASFLLALLAFAPVPAFAHAGHTHALGSEGGGRATPIASEAAAPSSHAVSRPSPSHTPAATVRSTDHPSSLLADFGKQDSQSCPSGCCQSVGATCCPAFLSSRVLLIAPPLGRSLYSELTDTGAGISPATLSEPPKSQV